MYKKFFSIKPKEIFTDITDKVQEALTYTLIQNGLVLVYSKHTTACIRVLENEILLKEDMKDFLERLAPSSLLYRHDDIEHRNVPPDERRNGHSHLKALFLNQSEAIPFFSNRLDLGKWQKIFFIDVDLGHEDRKWELVIIKG